MGSAAELSSSGIEMTVSDDSTSHFSARAIDTAGNVSGCSNSVEYVERTHVCRVPRLRGRPFRRAKRALKDADCKLGKVRRTKRKKTAGRRGRLDEAPGRLAPAGRHRRLAPRLEAGDPPPALTYLPNRSESLDGSASTARFDQGGPCCLEIPVDDRAPLSSYCLLLGAIAFPPEQVARARVGSHREALEACGDSQVGTGFFSANVLLPEQSPFPSRGKILAFNGEVLGHPVIFAHIYGTEPVPTSFVLPFVVRHTNGKYATTLVAYLPKVKANWGFITGVRLKLHRTFRFHGRPHTYLSASCAAPKGFSSAVFSFAKSEFVFAGGTTVSPALTRTCKVR